MKHCIVYSLIQQFNTVPSVRPPIHLLTLPCTDTVLKLEVTLQHQLSAACSTHSTNCWAGSFTQFYTLHAVQPAVDGVARLIEIQKRILFILLPLVAYDPER